MSRLFSSYKLRNLEFRNRLWVAPMCQYSAVDGLIGPWHLLHLTQFSVGGAGAIIAEATAVNPAGRISPGCAGIWNGEQTSAWAKVAQSVQEHGAKIGIQLNHAGRKASTQIPGKGVGTVPISEGGWQTVAPSAVAFTGYDAPIELSEAAIFDLITDFGTAAKNAVAAGFDFIELHAAHGYLLHQFLSPLSNFRTDKYGGDLQDRARLLLEVIAEVRAAIGPEMPLLIRYSASDWHESGLTPADIAMVVQLASAIGADFADISSGGLVAEQKISVGPGYQVPFAQQVSAESGTEVSAVGLITSGAQAEEILASEQVSVILAGRPWLRDPHFALQLAKELGVALDYIPLQYQRAYL